MAKFSNEQQIILLSSMCVEVLAQSYAKSTNSSVKAVKFSAIATSRDLIDKMSEERATQVIESYSRALNSI